MPPLILIAAGLSAARRWCASRCAKASASTENLMTRARFNPASRRACRSCAAIPTPEHTGRESQPCPRTSLMVMMQSAVMMAAAANT